MGKFNFALGQKVTISISGEQGEVHGRAEYTNLDNCYFVRYKAADGRAAEGWWQEDALQGA
jgi:uncharacterized membrane protein